MYIQYAFDSAYNQEFGCNFTAAIPTNVFGEYDNLCVVYYFPSLTKSKRYPATYRMPMSSLVSFTSVTLRKVCVLYGCCPARLHSTYRKRHGFQTVGQWEAPAPIYLLSGPCQIDGLDA